MDKDTELKVIELLKAGKKPRHIAKELNLKPEQIYTISSKLNHAGKKKTAKAPKRKGAKKTGPTGFEQLAHQEVERAEQEMARLERLQTAYAETNSEFASSLDKKIEIEQKKLAALHEYLNI